MIKITIGDKSDLFPPEEVASLIIKKLLDLLPQKETPEKICVTHPVDFDDVQKEALKRVFLVAGIKNKNNIILINEPTASAITFHQEYPEKFAVGNKVVVVDFGGSTFDVCCCIIQANPSNLRNNENILKILGIHGSRYLGGIRIDKILGDLIQRKINDNLRQFNREEIDFEKYFELQPDFSEEMRHIQLSKRNKFYSSTEIKKKILSEEQFFIAHSNYFVEEIPRNNNFVIKVTREEFEEAIENSGLLIEMIDIIKLTMKKNEVNWEPDDVTNVLAVGGICRIPSVRRKLEDFFGREKLSSESFGGNNTVVKGATIHAYRTKIGKVNVKETLPFSMFVKIINTGMKINIFKEGDELPKTVIRENITLENENETIFIELYKRDETTKIETKIDMFTLINKTKSKEIQFKFAIDSDGITRIVLMNENSEDRSEKISNTIALRDSQINRMIEHLSEYTNVYSDVHQSYSRQNDVKEIRRNFNPDHHSMGIYFGNNESMMFFRNTQTNFPELLIFKNRKTVNNCICIRKNDDSLILGNESDYVLKLNDLGKYMRSSEFRQTVKMAIGYDHNGSIVFNFPGVKKQHYLWDTFATYFDDINNYFFEMNKQFFGNIVMTIPNFMNKDTFECLKMGLSKSDIHHIELVKESYAAMIWFNHEHKGLVQEKNKMMVVNFKETGCEMDMIEIKQKTNNIIIETNRNDPEENKDIRLNIIDEIIKDIIMKIIEDENKEYYEQYIKCSNEERKQKAMNKIMIEIIKIKQSMKNIREERIYSFNLDYQEKK